MREDIEPGATSPDYELADHAGKRRRLAELQGGNAMVLHLSRGGYDPKELASAVRCPMIGIVTSTAHRLSRS